MTFRQMIYRNSTQEPLDFFLDLNRQLIEWQEKVLTLQKKYRRLPVVITDNLSGAQHVRGIEDTGIQPFGWSKYDDTPFLVPTRSPKGAGAKGELAQIGEGPAMIKEMVEKFDIPPYYRTKTDVYYPGMEVLESEKAGVEFTVSLFITYNVWPEPPQQPWDGGDHFELCSMSEFYALKGF